MKNNSSTDYNISLATASEITEKCIGEEPPFCQAACPLHIDNRKMVGLIREGKFSEALEVVLEKLPFPQILGRVCTRICESACKRGEIDGPIAICSLKRFVADMADKLPIDLSIETEKDQKVAIVGGGPSGMMAAYCLRKKGYKVTIFEAESFLGGATMLYIPPYRLPREIIRQETSIIPELGVEIKFNTKLGRDLSLDQLRRDYDVVFMAIGTQKSLKMAIRGENLEGVFHSVDLLRKVNAGQKVTIKDRIAVIGGGNVAIDAARTVLRLGASEVTILYRRTRSEMPAHETEVNDAEAEGIKMEYLTAPVEVLGKDKVEGIRCIKTELGPPDKSGRRRPVPVDGSEHDIPVDQIIIAIGLTPDIEGLADQGLEMTKWNTLKVNPDTLQTVLPDVFAGGDIVNGPDTVVGALAHGRQAAFAIDSFLKNGKASPIPYELMPWDTELIVDISNVQTEPRQDMPHLSVDKRVNDFSEVELGFNAETAIKEAERCLSCECRQCVKNCSYLEHYCYTPKDLAQQFQHPKQDQLVVPYSCNICSLCETVCPQGLNVGTLCMETREQLVHLGLGPLPQHNSIKTNQKWGTSKYFTLNLADIATGKCKRVFFPGCGLPGYSPHLVINMYNYLRERLPDTGIVLNCCGAPTHLLGDHEGFNAILGATVKQIQDMGAEEIIFACPDCFHTFKDFAPGMKFSTVYQAMAELGTPEPVIKAGNTAFSIHDSCITRHETDLQESVRHLIRSMGYGIEELDYSRELTKCCGAGGMAANANPKFLTQVIKKRADESPYDYITYCAGCRLTFAYVKKPVLHVLDLLFSSDLEKGKLKPPPNPLVKWWNRWKLKKTLQNMGS